MFNCMGYHQVKERCRLVAQTVFCLIDDAKVRTKRGPAKEIVAGWEFAGVYVGVSVFFAFSGRVFTPFPQRLEQFSLQYLPLPGKDLELVKLE